MISHHVLIGKKITEACVHVFFQIRRFKRVLVKVLLLLVALGLGYVGLSSSFNQFAGSIFFGRVPALYNVTLAHFFYWQSAYPVFGTARPFSHYELSRSYFIQGNLHASLEEIEKELEMYPENVRAYYMLGLTYGYLNQEDKAIMAFSKFIEKNPESWAARNDKAWLQFRMGDIEGGLLTIDPVKHDTDNPWVQNTYGTLLMNKKRYKDAHEAFLKAKQAAESMTEASWGVAYPGNDPRVYQTGLRAMRLSIESNLKLIEGK